MWGKCTPLQSKTIRIAVYTVMDDSTEELSAGEVEARVCALTMLKVGETHVFDPPVTPFSTENTVPEVII